MYLIRLYTAKPSVENSDQQIVIFPANRSRNRFAEPTSVQVGIGIIFVRGEVFANDSQIPYFYFFFKKFLKTSFLDSFIFFI